jgi:SM-20-related protein
MPASLAAGQAPKLAWPLDELVAALCADGYWVGVAQLSPDRVAALRSSAGILLASDGYTAGVGRQHQLTVDRRIRGDRIAWIDAATPAPLQAWLADLQLLAERLREPLRLPLRGVEGMVACYPPGAGYERHIDQHRGVESRLLSCIAYLNPDWRPGDGGELEVWPQGADGPSRLIAPRGGSFAIMRADLLHAVRPAQRPRYSLTAWLRRG